MIYDDLKNAGRYFKTGDAFDRALAFVLGFDPKTPDGRYEIEGTALYALVSSYETEPADTRRFETHRIYADVQVLIGGEERIDSSPEAPKDVVVEYNGAKDIEFWGVPRRFISLAMTPGTFAVFFPNELHRPNCHLDAKAGVRKIVVKVRMP